MSRKGNNDWAPILAAGAVAAGSVAAIVALGRRPTMPAAAIIPFDDRDVEAAARMLASENPSGSLQLHVEQVYTQARQALRKGIQLYDQITAGSGFGGQGEKSWLGGVRPVSTSKPASSMLLQRAREILEGRHRSQFERATKYFEPAAQNRAFAIAERGRKKQAAGEPLTAEEARLLKYRRDASSVRARWGQGGMHLGTVDGVEFWS